MGLDPFIGEIQAFAGTYVPDGWMLCDGTTLQVSQQQVLFAVIGSRFGGDGRNTFKLPDLGGRLAVGVGNGPGLTPWTLGDAVGHAAISLSAQNLPSHSHAANVEVNATVQATDVQGSVAAPVAGVVLAAGFDIERATIINNYTSATGSSVPLTGASLTVEGNLSDVGQSAAHENRMPFVALRYIIAVTGIYPAHN